MLLFLIKMKKLRSKRTSDLPRVTELEADRARKPTRVSDSTPVLLTAQRSRLVTEQAERGLEQLPEEPGYLPARQRGQGCGKE